MRVSPSQKSSASPSSAHRLQSGPCFPEDHPLFQGELVSAMLPLSQQLAVHDLIIVIGAPVFRYYPFVPGPIVPEGAKLLQITDDPTDAGSALVGDSLLSDAKLAIEALLDQVAEGTGRTAPALRKVPRDLPATPGSPLTAIEVYAALSEVRPEGAIVVQESPSNYNDFLHWWPSKAPGEYYTYASGGLGHNAPSSVGVALAQRKLGTNRPVIALIGDGSLQYSIQSLSAAAHNKLKVIFIVPCNGEYAILKEFADLEQTPNVPALDLPFLDIPSLAKGYGCATAKPLHEEEEIQEAFKKALATDGPHRHRNSHRERAQVSRSTLRKEVIPARALTTQPLWGLVRFTVTPASGEGSRHG